jgi:CubicO group peptidase (beta-lactamase class C family)
MKQARIQLTYILLFIFFAGSAISQNDSKKTFQNQVDEYMQRYVNNGDFSGNVLIAKGNEILFQRSYGKANYELDVPIAKDVLFRIASVSKTFTAAAITLLCNKGLMNYSDRLSKYVPGFIQSDSITVRQLLLHQAGVADIDYDKLALDKLSLDEVVNTIKNKPLYFKPGTEFRYSNSGYLLLAIVIEKVSGISYDKFLGENIFTKLGMNHTGIDHIEKIIPGKATGYSVGAGANGIATAAWYDINLEAGSGSVYSTTSDLLRWLQAIKNKTLFDITSLVYPFGWGARTYFPDKKSIEQSGFLNGYSSYIGLYPSEDLYVIALSNISSNFNEQSGKDLAAIYFKEPYNLPEIRKDITAVNLSNYTGKYSWPGYKDFFIEQKGETIYWRFTDEKTGSPLAPISEDVFLLRLMNNKIIFKKDTGGKVIELNFISSNSGTACKKVG